MVDAFPVKWYHTGKTLAHSYSSIFPTVTDLLSSHRATLTTWFTKQKYKLQVLSHCFSSTRNNHQYRCQHKSNLYWNKIKEQLRAAFLSSVLGKTVRGVTCVWVLLSSQPRQQITLICCTAIQSPWNQSQCKAWEKRLLRCQSIKSSHAWPCMACCCVCRVADSRGIQFYLNKTLSFSRYCVARVCSCVDVHLWHQRQCKTSWGSLSNLEMSNLTSTCCWRVNTARRTLETAAYAREWWHFQFSLCFSNE